MTLDAMHRAAPPPPLEGDPPARPAPGGRVYNFTAGPAAYPLEVMVEVREALYDYEGLGAGIIEISHRSDQFHRIIDEIRALLADLLGIPEHYRVLFCHGGGQLQFSMVPLNLIGRLTARKAFYIDTGSFASRAIDIATRYGFVHVPGHSRENDYDRIPAFEPAWVDADASYLHITTNNTAMGTAWWNIPDTGDMPLVGDATSEIGSRVVDITRFGLLYAGAQKNLGPPGLAVVIIREDLLGHALPGTPQLLNYTDLAGDRYSMRNTPSTLSLYMALLMLRWLKAQGGVPGIEQRNAEKAALVYRAIDQSGFYHGFALPEHRSHMNITFGLPGEDLSGHFVAEALQAGMFGLKGHRARGGIRASIYNAMPLEGARLLVEFMADFERRHG